MGGEADFSNTGSHDRHIEVKAGCLGDENDLMRPCERGDFCHCRHTLTLSLP